ncbi:MAG: GPW/gp25 family protein [Burkholderiales bacterium]|nr:GPW/gp25 family protein [Burkholderiales bacterium]
MRDFLGRGLAFPLHVDAAGRLAGAAGEARVEDSIHLVLSTRPGERVMLPNFGCAIHDLVYAPNNPATRTRAVDAVRRALTQLEARIDVLDVRADTSPAEPHLLLLRVDYRLRANNAVGNLVYPFFLLEAA